MREPKLGVACGKKGVGKSYTTNLLIKKYMQGNPEKGIKPRRALIIDINDEYDHIRTLSARDIQKFSVQPNCEVRRIRTFSEKTGKVLTIDQIVQLLGYVLEYYRCGLLLLEDLNAYIGDNPPFDFLSTIVRNRHFELDIIIHYQSIGRITPKIWQNMNFIRFHKNTDSVDRHENKFIDKYECLKIVELMVNKQYRTGNVHFYSYMDVEEIKINGINTEYNLDFKKILIEAIDEYLHINEKDLITPLLSRKNNDGDHLFSNYSDAINSQRIRLLKEYSDF